MTRKVLLTELDFTPLWREQYLRQPPIGDYPGNTEWSIGPPMYKAIEWVEIDPVIRERLGALVPDKLTDRTEAIVALLEDNHIPYTVENSYVKIWGYRRPGSNE